MPTPGSPDDRSLVAATLAERFPEFAERFPETAEAFALLSAVEDPSLDVPERVYERVDRDLRLFPKEVQPQVRAVLDAVEPRIVREERPPPAASDPETVERAQANWKMLETMAAVPASYQPSRAEMRWGTQLVRWITGERERRPRLHPRSTVRRHSSRRVERVRTHGRHPPSSDDDPPEPPPDGLTGADGAVRCPRCGELVAGRVCPSCRDRIYVELGIALLERSLERR
jgi:hypothetical protein